MISMGFVFSTNDFRCVVLEEDGDSIELLDKQKIIFPQSYTPSETTAWMETQLKLLVEKFKPDVIGHKATLSVTKINQVQRTYYAEAILYLICGKKSIPIHHFMKQSIVPSKFNLPKGTDLFKFVDEKLGQHPPYWDENTRTSALIAMLVLR